MQGFIQVTTEDRLHCLISVEKIIAVYQLPSGRAFIKTQECKHKSYGIEVLDDYDEVLDKIAEQGSK